MGRRSNVSGNCFQNGRYLIDYLQGGDLEGFPLIILQLLDIGLKLWAVGKWLQLIFLSGMVAGGIAILRHRRKATQVELLGPRPSEGEEDDDDEPYLEKNGKEEPPPEYIPYD